MTCFAKGLSDMNLKVSIHSLSALLRIIPLYNTKIDPHVGALLSPIGLAVGSSNSSIRCMAVDVVECVIENWKATLLVNPLLSAAINANSRGKSILMKYLASIFKRAYSLRPGIVTKNFMRTLLKLSNDKNSEARIAFNKLLSVVFEWKGLKIMEMIPSNNIQFFMNFVNKL